MKNRCVICDHEKEYAIGLMDYINRKKTLPFDGIACTSKDSLLEYAKEHPIDILLVAESMMEEEIGSIPAVVTIVLGEGYELEYCRAYAQVYKYQSCETLMNEVMETFGQTSHAAFDFGATKRQGARLIGVYSPCSTQLGTAFALAAGQILAERKKVLFLDITQFSGLDVLYAMKAGQGLGDILYLSERRQFDLNVKLSAIVCERFGMDIIPPLSSPEDLFGVPSEKWSSLFAELAEKSAYDILIADIGIPSFSLMDLCTQLYVPLFEDEWSRIRTESFLSSLGRSRYREVQERTETFLTGRPSEFTAERLKENPAAGRLGKAVSQALQGVDLL